MLSTGLRDDRKDRHERAQTPWRAALARRPELLPAAVVGLLLLLTSGRYGYHRDELYFLEAGHHLAWGYPDQPPLVPAIARLMSAAFPDSLVALRLPSALVAVAVVALAGSMARLLGAGRAGQLLAAVATALSGPVLAMGHLLSTSTFDLLGWTVLTFLVLRLLQGGGPRLWLVAGAAAGLTMQANVLVAFLLFGLFVALLLVGPRAVLVRPWPWLGAVIALLLGLPYLLWQAHEGWPQLDVASNIAAGGSGSSASRLAFLPLLVLQLGPWLTPVWAWGLVRLWRDAALRCLAATFGVLVVVFLALGGKPYYLAGLVPLLLAAGAQPVLDWAGRVAVRRWAPVALLVLSLPALVFTLPLLPVRSAGPVVAVNWDVGETIGWPQVVGQVADVYATLPAGTPIVTSNYGQAGAIDRYGPALGLPSAYSGHNGYGRWGHPVGDVPALLVGGDPTLLARECTRLRAIKRLRNANGIDNEENGTLLSYCVPRDTWRVLWPEFTHIG